MVRYSNSSHVNYLISVVLTNYENGKAKHFIANNKYYPYQNIIANDSSVRKYNIMIILIKNKLVILINHVLMVDVDIIQIDLIEVNLFIG